MSGSGNGADAGQMLGMLRDVLTAQNETRGELRAIDRKVDGVGSSVENLQAEVGGLRQMVVEYHSAVLGRGVLISELEARIRRVERHLNLPPAAA